MTTSPEQKARPGDPARVLIVDDNERNLEALEASLRTPSYDIVRARSGKEALRHLMNGDVAVLLLDVNMPEMDGFECARLVKSNHRYGDLPIIFLTGVANDPEFVMRGYAAGGVDYIVKPFEAAVVRAKVAIFVELFRSRRLLHWQIDELRSLSDRLHSEIESKAQLLQMYAKLGRPTAPGAAALAAAAVDRHDPSRQS